MNSPQSPDLGQRLMRLLRRMRAAGESDVRREMLGDVPDCGVEARDVSIYLPPGFEHGQRVPLLIALDGQNMSRWQLAETLAELAGQGEREAPIVAAVPSSTARVDEYGLPGARDYKGRGVFAAKFQRYLVEGVLPAVRRRYFAGLERERTGIFGASMGGLCAFDTAWGHPDVFGFAGIFSGSLWWRADNSTPAAQQSSRLVHARVRNAVAKPAVKFWFQAGTEDETEDRDGNGVIDAIQDTTELVDELVTKGYCRDGDVVYRETSGGRHNEQTWAGELPEFFRWALPRR